MLTRRHLLLSLVYIVTACKAEQRNKERLTVGFVSYEDNQSTQRYLTFTDYLATTLKTFVELEPVFNEVRALEQIKKKNWQLIFAPPGLAAIAISEEQYLPIFTLQGVQNTRSVILVRQESSYQKITDLANQAVALGQPGSATGYYLPLYNLYGLTLSQIRVSPTPKTTLKWIEQGDVAAGALSLAEFERYRSEFKKTKFRAISQNSVPAGAMLIAPTLKQDQQEQIKHLLELAPPQILDSAGYIPNAKLPNYQELIKVVNKVKPFTKRLKDKPINLYNK